MIYSTILLVYVISSKPVQLRVVDRLTSFTVCEEVIRQVKKSEESEPEDERIGDRLQCISVNFKSDHDDDGPSKPVAVPEKPSVSVPVHEPYPCRHPIYNSVVPCKEATYKE